MSAATQNRYARDAREVVSLATRMCGRKRGWALAAEHLGVSERVIHAIVYGESARPDPQRIAAARIALGRARVAQLRAELAQIEGDLHASTVDLAGAEAHPCG